MFLYVFLFCFGVCVCVCVFWREYISLIHQESQLLLVTYHDFGSGGVSVGSLVWQMMQSCL